MLWNRLDGIDDVSADIAVAWLASVSVYTVNVHESALDSVLGTVECNLHHCVKWNLQWTKEKISMIGVELEN